MWYIGKNVYLWDHQQIWPDKDDFWYSEDNYAEYQSLVNSVWSVQFQDSGKRYRFNSAIYIWDRTAINFNWTTMSKVNLDTLTTTSSKTISVQISSRPRYFGENRILTDKWILDFDGNIITSFSYNRVTPWLPWVVRANSGYDIYKGVVNWDNITFTKIGTWWTDQNAWWMNYWYLWAYLLNENDNSWSWNSSYINPSTDAISNIAWGSNSRQNEGFAWPDGKLYRAAIRTNWRGMYQKIWTASEWFVWDSLGTAWLSYGRRFIHFLGNFVSWWMNSNNWTGNGYGSNNYFIDTSWTLTKVQTNALAYDTEILWYYWFIDENWWIYPATGGGWSWVILKTDKTFTNLNWKNPYLWR